MSESSKRSRAACGKASIPRDPGRAGEGAARSALRSVPSPCSLRLSMSGVGARRRGDAAAAASSSATMRSPERPSCPPGRRCRGPSIGNWAGVSRPAHNGRNLASRAHRRKGDDVSVLIKSDSNSPYIEGFSPSFKRHTGADRQTDAFTKNCTNSHTHTHTHTHSSAYLYTHTHTHTHIRNFLSHTLPTHSHHFITQLSCG